MKNGITALIILIFVMMTVILAWPVMAGPFQGDLLDKIKGDKNKYVRMVVIEVGEEDYCVNISDGVCFGYKPVPYSNVQIELFGMGVESKGTYLKKKMTDGYGKLFVELPLTNLTYKITASKKGFKEGSSSIYIGAKPKFDPSYGTMHVVRLQLEKNKPIWKEIEVGTLGKYLDIEPEVATSNDKLFFHYGEEFFIYENGWSEIDIPDKYKCNIYKNGVLKNNALYLFQTSIEGALYAFTYNCVTKQYSLIKPLNNWQEHSLPKKYGEFVSFVPIADDNVFILARSCEKENQPFEKCDKKKVELIHFNGSVFDASADLFVTDWWIPLGHVDHIIKFSDGKEKVKPLPSFLFGFVPHKGIPFGEISVLSPKKFIVSSSYSVYEPKFKTRDGTCPNYDCPYTKSGDIGMGVLYLYDSGSWKKIYETVGCEEMDLCEMDPIYAESKDTIYFRAGKPKHPQLWKYEKGKVSPLDICNKYDAKAHIRSFLKFDDEKFFIDYRDYPEGVPGYTVDNDVLYKSGDWCQFEDLENLGTFIIKFYSVEDDAWVVAERYFEGGDKNFVILKRTLEKQ